MNIKEQIEREAETRYPILQVQQAAFIKGANFALELDRWVKCSEMIPDSTDYVLATDGVYIDVMHYNVRKRAWGSDTITPTHWQPLPNLPQ